MRLTGLMVLFAVCCATVGLTLNGLGTKQGVAAEKSKENSAAKKTSTDDTIKRELWTTSKVVGSPDPPLPYRLKRVYPQLQFEQPIAMQPEPGTDRLWVLELSGKFYSIPDSIESHEEVDDSQKIELADLSMKEFRREFLGFTFHPNYEKNKQVFAFIGMRRNKPEPVDGKPVEFDKDAPENHEFMRISRFTMTDEKTPRIDAKSELEIIRWLSAGHAGGGIEFGPQDGYLYLTSGDGTTGSDVDNTGQDISDLRACLLRIDVDHPDEGRNYSIPKDNPFLEIKTARPEVYAFGLRAPWRMSFDPPTNNLWVGDVGQDLWEMIHLIKPGGNYGWSVREGSHPFITERKVGPAAISPPIVEYHHSVGRSVTGGYVYRGDREKSLQGQYIYCDYETGKTWGFHYENDKMRDHQMLTSSSYKVASFGLDHKRNVYPLGLSGELFELEAVPSTGEKQEPFPVKLSDTGLFHSTQPLQPAAGLIPYEVNAPVWHDDAKLERYIAVPGDEKITFSDRNGWDFVDGSVMVQTVSLPVSKSDKQAMRKVETRIMTRQDGQWYAYTYLWDEAESDAVLIGENGIDHVIDIEAEDGNKEQATWHVPSRSECMACHSRAAKFVLGLSTLQMNRDVKYENKDVNQLRLLSRMGILEKLPDESKKKWEDLDSLANPYSQSDELNARARSYLHANCSHCHVKDGGGNARMELTYWTEDDEAKIFDVEPMQGNFTLLQGRLIAPGDPYRSVLLYRISKLGRGRMPHLGSQAVDEKAVELFHDWIAQLPEPKEKPTQHDEILALQTGDERAQAALAETSPSPDAALERLLSTPAGALRLICAITANQLAKSNMEAAIQAGTNDSNVYVRDLFERFLPEDQRIKRLGNVFDAREILGLGGDAGRGRSYFFETAGVQCQNCHQIHGKGRQVGPDLSEVGSRLDRQKILDNIINPSKVIDEKFVTYVVANDDGKVFTGLLIKKTDEEIVLRDNENKTITIPTDEIDFMVKQEKSLMPELLLRDATAQQAADLVEFLFSLKKK